MPRPRNRRPVSVAITPSAGQWVAFVPVGRKPDGTADRRKRSTTMCADCKVTPTVGCDCYEVCADKIRELEDQVAAKKVTKAGRAQTLGQYLGGWLEGVEDNLEYKTFVSYRGCVRRLQGGPLSGIEVPDVEPALITRELKSIGRDVSPNEAHKVWRVLRSALSDYEREHPTVRNMAKLAKPPKVTPKKIMPFTVDEVRRIFAAIERRGARARARWYLAITGGQRQGETLGLSWHRPDEPDVPPDIDLDTGTVTVREKQYRRTWEHGCDDPRTCGARLHKIAACPDPCTRHTRACPPPCSSSCDKHASSCPKRHSGGLVKGTPKNKKERSQALAVPVVEAVREWKRQQDAERARAGSQWVDSGRVFTQPLGAPIDARRDWGELQAILADAGVHRAGVHSTRHTAATFMRLLKVDRRVVMGEMGWSTSAIADRYEHHIDEMSRDAADRMGGLLWPAATPQTDPDGPGSATDLATAEGAKILPFRRKAG